LRRRLPVAGPGPGFRVAETERSVEVEVRRDDIAIDGLGEAMVDIVLNVELQT
jgi:hypothetical protein